MSFVKTSEHMNVMIISNYKMSSSLSSSGERQGIEDEGLANEAPSEPSDAHSPQEGNSLDDRIIEILTQSLPSYPDGVNFEYILIQSRIYESMDVRDRLNHLISSGIVIEKFTDEGTGLYSLWTKGPEIDTDEPEPTEEDFKKHSESVAANAVDIVLENLNIAYNNELVKNDDGDDENKGFQSVDEIFELVKGEMTREQLLESLYQIGKDGDLLIKIWFGAKFYALEPIDTFNQDETEVSVTGLLLGLGDKEHLINDVEQEAIQDIIGVLSDEFQVLNDIWVSLNRDQHKGLLQLSLRYLAKEGDVIMSDNVDDNGQYSYKLNPDNTQDDPEEGSSE